MLIIDQVILASLLSNKSRASRYSLLSFGYRSSLMFVSSLKLVFERTLDGCSWPVADIGPSANLNHLLSASVSRLRRWRALVRKREPVVVEHEPTA